MTGYRELTQAQLVAEAKARFGPDPYAWAFACPHCGDVATGADFRDALDARPATGRDGTPLTASSLLGQECIGRRSATPDRGCDWAAYGLFCGPWKITTPDGKTMWSFPLAPADKETS